MVGRDVVVVGQGLFVALDGDGVLLALEPPVDEVSFFEKFSPIYL